MCEHRSILGTFIGEAKMRAQERTPLTRLYGYGCSAGQQKTPETLENKWLEPHRRMLILLRERF